MPKKKTSNIKGNLFFKIFDTVSFKIIPLALSILAIIISYFAYKASYGENLLINAQRINEDYLSNIIISKDFKTFPSLIEVKYACKLTNNSNKPISIIEYQAIGYGSICCKMEYDISGKQRVDFPIKFEPYETKKFFFNLVYQLDSVKMKILRSEISDLNLPKFEETINVPYKIIENVLYKHQSDIFGNKVLKWYSGYTVGDRELKQVVYLLKFTTSSENVFERKVGYYPFEDEILKWN